MVQCRFRKGLREQTAWIDEKGAKIGMLVELKTEKEGDQEDWQVIGVGTRKDEAYVRERERDYKKTRDASDI
jgi:hypothetical protein